MDIGERIKKRREALGMSAEKLGEKIGKAKTTIYRYETGYIENMPLTVLDPIAKALNTTPAYLMGWEDDPIFNQYDNILPIAKKKIPFLGEVACGKPIYASEDRESYIECGAEVKADFCLKAKGDSMINARIHNGDIVFVRKQSTVENGDIAVVIIDDEATLKRVYIKPHSLVLMPENTSYEPIVVNPTEHNEIRILGKAIAFQSDIR